jgi:DNA polymerase elongation subunit (family B)
MQTHNFALVGGDTDGLAFKKQDQSMFTLEERKALLDELNSYMDGLIHWEDDGVFKRQLVIRTKNYVLVDEGGNKKTKGSALKATMKEKALKQFVQDVIELLLKDRQDMVYFTYMRYAREILSLTDMSQWCSKKTITKAVLTNTRTNEKRIRDALKGRPVQEGDKIYTYFKTPTEIALLQDFDGTYDVDTLLGKLYDTLCIFERVIDVSLIPNLTLKRNKQLLTNL